MKGNSWGRFLCNRPQCNINGAKRIFAYLLPLPGKMHQNVLGNTVKVLHDIAAAIKNTRREISGHFFCHRSADGHKTVRPR